MLRRVPMRTSLQFLMLQSCPPGLQNSLPHKFRLCCRSTLHQRSDHTRHNSTLTDPPLLLPRFELPPDYPPSVLCNGWYCHCCRSSDEGLHLPQILPSTEAVLRLIAAMRLSTSGARCAEPRARSQAQPSPSRRHTCMYMRSKGLADVSHTWRARMRR